MNIHQEQTESHSCRSGEMIFNEYSTCYEEHHANYLMHHLHH